MYSSFFAKSFMTSFKIVFSVEISEFSDQLRCETICNKVEMYRNVFYRYLKQSPDLLLVKSKKTSSNDTSCWKYETKMKNYLPHTHSHTHSKFEKYHISYPLHPKSYPLQIWKISHFIPTPTHFIPTPLFHFIPTPYPLHIPTPIPTPSGVGMGVG